MEQGSLGELLLADDDQAFLDVLVKTFRRDFVVHAASDGARAITMLGLTRPTVVLVDEMMPHATGTQVLMAAKGQHPHAARMLMTASTELHHAVEAINQGEIHRFFSKPVRPMELRQAVLGVVERVRHEELMRVELETLNRIRSPGPVKVRALMAGVVDSQAEALRRMCAARGYELVEEPGPTAVAVHVANRSVDLLLLGSEVGDTLAELVQVARCADESVAVVLVEPEPSLANAMLAMRLGISDYLAPLPARDELHHRMERAVHPHLVHRDVQRVQRELLGANRELALSRRKQEEQNVRVLNSMIRALEARDSYTAGHTDRVATISVRLGQELDYGPDRLEIIRVGALLHDIGKIGVPDAVLLKPDKLTLDEFDAIKTHATLGWELLKDVDQFRCVAPVVRSHHERLDGSGYPDALVGDAISMESRVVAVADIMDAITSTRPYRSATDVQSALDVISEQEGRALDRTVCEALRSLHRAGRLEDLLQFPYGAT